MEKIPFFLGLLLAAVPLANTLIPSPTNCIIDELRQNPSNPHTFYSCTPYGPVLFQCPGELFFSVQLNKCVFTLNSDENQSSESEESTTENPTEISPIGSSEEDETSEEENSSEEITTIQTTVKPAPTISTEKQTMTTETPTKSTKPPETTTQQITTTTKKSSTTTRFTTKPPTTTTRKTTTTIQTTTRPPGAIICEPGRIYYPDPTTCSKFYQCANGIPHRFSCPAGLNFNPNINVCDWPWNYPCPL